MNKPTTNTRVPERNRSNPAENKQFAAISPGPVKPPTACFLASDWRPLDKATLLGAFNLTLPSGLIIKGCTYHKSHSSYWVGLPSQSHKDKNGDVQWTNILDFASRPARTRFQEQAMAAIEKLLRDGEGK